MTKTIPIAAAALLAVLATEASAQSRAFYDSAGRVIGRSATDSAGTVTHYDSSGRVISRTSTDSNGATTVHARGRKVGRTTRR
jgi:YD repeat-containing protein